VIRVAPKETSIATALRAYRRAILSAAGFSGLINVLMLTSPLFMMQIFDRVLTSRSLSTLVALSLLVAGVFAFVGLLELVRMRLMAHVAAAIDARVRGAAFDAVLGHALKGTVEVRGQPLRDLEIIRQFIAGSGPFALFELPWMPLYVAVNYLLDPLLGMMTFGGVLILFALAAVNDLVTRRATGEASAASQRAHAMAEDARRSVEVMAAMGMASAYRQRWAQEFEAAQWLQLNANDRASIPAALTKGLRLLLQSAVLAVGAALAIQGFLSPGALIAASILMSRALAPVEQATAHWASLQAARRAHQRLRQALDAAPRRAEAMELPMPEGAIAVESLAVASPGASTPILMGIEFRLKPGDGVGIIGPTGSGKSTLARALVGVWPAGKGQVRIDGAALDQWPAAQLGRIIGYVPQVIELLTGTVRENIGRFTINPDWESVVRAAQRANVHDMILHLPRGYETVLGEGGVRLSAGQLQRIALARALYGEPVILVLDEPNSNLDAAGEAALTRTVLELRRDGVTVVVIAHRRKALEGLDTLLYLREGRQIAFGPKEQVLALVTEGSKAPSNPAMMRPVVVSIAPQTPKTNRAR
jgi:PrtD family type I secretion system ABC transporter